MGSFVTDVRYAFRMMGANPGFTIVATAALALGIGANTAIFTVVNAVLLQPLPYSEPDRIMQLMRRFPNNQTGNSISIPKYMVWRQNQSFEAMALYGQSGPGMNLGSGEHPEQIKSVQTSEGYFRVFGVAPAMGRTYTAAEDIPNGPNVAVVSYSLWQSRLGGSQSVVGSTVTLNGAPYTVIGVLSRGFRADPPADVFLPNQADPNSANQGNYLRVAGRLKPGMSVDAARAEMKVVGERYRAKFPTFMDKTESIAVIPMREATVGDVKPALLILLGAVMFVLVIACANVANLLLARAAVRQREIAVRAAVGANRWRVVQQLLTESVLLASVGGVLGYVLGSWGVRGLLLMAPGNIPRLTDADGIHATIPPLDWHVAAFTIGIALLTGIVFGLYPAFHASNPDLASMLKEGGGRSGTGRRQHRARSVLVVGEVALALVLLIGAALLIRTFTGLQNVNPGFDSHNVLTMKTSMAGAKYATTAGVDNFVTQTARRIESVPGVEAAASTIMLPVECCVDLPFNIQGKAPTQGQYTGDEQWRAVSPHYFQAFKISLLRGRVFRENDYSNSTRVVVINEKMAKEYWPKENPIGQEIVIGKGLGPQFDDPPRQIVGVVSNVRESGLSRGEVGVMYIPQSQVPEGMTQLASSVLPLAWVVRTKGDPGSLRSAIEREIRETDSTIPLTDQRTMEEVVAASVARQNFNMVVLSIFAGIALLLAAIGIYGLMAYTVQQRTQEVGIRMALGAVRRDIIKLIVAHGMKLALAGVVVGAVLAYATTRLLGALLFGVKANDPITFAGVAAVLTAVALFATLIPARRASAVEPSTALRQA
ncbi:MAG TPA: ABC transporter permease [Bryobacteraceae bacterium]|jgi:predicted permease|nr:ABC transporter permease [Bryobacteraceae bacterium]